MSETNNRRTRATRRKATRHMAMCAVLCALSVVVLAFGTLLEILDLTSAFLAATVILLILMSYGPRYAWLSYAVTGVVGLIFMPQSLAVWTYIGLAGYYPVIKRPLDRLPRAMAWLVKLALFAAVMALCLAVFHFLILGGEGSLLDSFLRLFDEESGKTAMAWAVLGLSLFTYVLFDLLLDRLTILYCLRWQKRVEKWMKP